MQLITVRLPDSHNIFGFGDVHEGSELSHLTGFEELKQAMQHPYRGCAANFGIDMGDAIEAIMVDDKRFHAENDDVKVPLPLRQLKVAIERRREIAPMLITMLDSNHLRKLWKFGNLTGEMCEELGVKYGTYAAKIRVCDMDGNLMYKIYATHGRKAINSTADDKIRRNANMRLILKRHLKFKAGDCAVMLKAHAHKLIVSEPETELYLIDDGQKIRQRYTSYGQNEEYIHPDQRWYGCTGSFLKLFGDGVSGYAEIAEYDPVELGFLVLKVRDKKIIGLEPYYIS